MKLLLIFAAILAFSLAEEEKKKEEILDDSEAEASATIELLKEGADLSAAASSYNTYVPPSQRPPQWTQPKPIQPVNTGVPAGVQNDYYDSNNIYQPTWQQPNYHPHPPTTTTPTPVIKNEQYFGDNGYYKYEYQLGDGTHVAEEGYFTDPSRPEESIVKKGFYSYVGADKKKYTVTYYADKTGYHAFGDHLPKENQPAFDNKPQHDYPTQTTPAPVFYPTQAPAPQKPVYVPPQPPIIPQKPIYNPPQPTLPPLQQPTYQPATQPPVYNPPQTFYPPQPTYPSQPTYPQNYPNQQNYYPQHPGNSY